MTGVHVTYRHRCPGADQMYDEGIAVVFCDAAQERWVFAQAEPDAWYAWDADQGQPHPLTSLDAGDYWTSVDVGHCPWCAVKLAEDPAYLAHVREASLPKAPGWEGLEEPRPSRARVRRWG